jgi:hypothetical protein
MRSRLLMALPVSAVVAVALTMPNVATDANAAAPLCRAPGVPKGCVTRPAVRSTPNPVNSYNSANATRKGHIIVPAPPGGRPIGHCMECIAPHYAWPPSGGAP